MSSPVLINPLSVKQGIIRALKNSQRPVDNYLLSIIQAVCSQHACALDCGKYHS